MNEDKQTLIAFILATMLMATKEELEGFIPLWNEMHHATYEMSKPILNSLKTSNDVEMEAIEKFKELVKSLKNN